MNLKNLSDKQINAYVSQAMGNDVLGQAVLCYCPESGSLQLDYDQKERPTGIMKTHQGYVYLYSCQCEFLKQCSESDEEFYRLVPQRQLLRHDESCLKPVPDYCNDSYAGMEIIKKYRISLVANDEHEWSAFKDGECATSHSSLRAVMELFVMLNKDVLDNKIINENM